MLKLELIFGQFKFFSYLCEKIVEVMIDLLLWLLGAPIALVCIYYGRPPFAMFPLPIIDKIKMGKKWRKIFIEEQKQRLR